MLYSDVAVITGLQVAKRRTKRSYYVEEDSDTGISAEEDASDGTCEVEVYKPSEGII